MKIIVSGSDMLQHVICNGDGFAPDISLDRIPLTDRYSSENLSNVCPDKKTWLILELADFIHDAVLTETVSDVRDRLSEYVQFMKNTLDPSRVILVRTFYPQKAVDRNRVSTLYRKNRELINRTLTETEEWIIQQLKPVVIDIARFYYLDLQNKDYGPIISYEPSFFVHLEAILRKIILHNVHQPVWNAHDCGLMLDRWLSYYTYHSFDYHDSLYTNTVIDQIVPSLSKDVVRRYQHEILKMAAHNAESLHDLLETFDFSKCRGLKTLLSLTELIHSDGFARELNDLSLIFRENLGIRTVLLMKLKKLYREEGLITPEYINLQNLENFWNAWVLYQKENYRGAAKCLLPPRQFYRIARCNSEFSLKKTLGKYSFYHSIAPVDVWGSYLSRNLAFANPDAYRVQTHVKIKYSSALHTDPDRTDRLLRRHMGWIIVDMFAFGENVDILTSKALHNIKQLAVSFFQILRSFYGEHIIFNRITVAGSDAMAFQDHLIKTYHLLTVHSSLDEFIPGKKVENSQLSQIIKRDQMIYADVLVYFYGNGNVGDDLFFDILVNRYKDKEFTVLLQSASAKSFCSQYKNVKIYSQDSILRVKSCNTFILIGGSMFTQPLNWYRKIAETRDFLKVSRKKFMLGINFGPYTDENYLQEYRKIFRLCSDVCFREQYSFHLFRDLKNVRCEADIVFSQRYRACGNTGAAISLISLSHRKELEQYQDTYIRSMTMMCRDIIREGLTVRLLCFCVNEKDNVAAEAIWENLDESEKAMTEKVFYHGNLNEFLHILGSVKYLIGTRFHANVLGFLMQKTVYPIVYSQKTVHMLEDAGFNGACGDIRASELITWDKVKQNEGSCLKNLDLLRTSAGRQFAALDRHFSKKH
ncbi:polysaccharide pyruvyl transferase family protein [Ruminococcus sp. OA3]|uniref:polysaccharide pyruvyl transferase family protein n=1 Tax=Ruminococcus sp. OA3 TaxID=2914164 RepID=UPI001F05B07C|nr:polysaccharide pyruvyl transferase family protein [Ruminococcus sp. OA3]MCH1981748.1 polysaccharide pyruvyl transferase family protein [Ruminococcus sp. OA3]